MSDLMTGAAIRYRDTHLTTGNIRSAEAWDAANDGLAAIEAEATHAERARITEAVRGLRTRFASIPDRDDPLASYIRRLAVLAIVNPEEAVE